MTVTLPIRADLLVEVGATYEGRRVVAIERDWSTLTQTLELAA